MTNDQNLLGKKTDYPQQYHPEILFRVPRATNRESLNIATNQPFVGVDVWNAYELSWLSAKGKPQVAVARFTIPANSPYLVESKSFKLYLNSLNQHRFESQQEVADTLVKDISQAAGAQVELELFSASDASILPNTQLPGVCLDDLDIEISDFKLSPEQLQLSSQEGVTETIHSHLLKSNCAITDQPDWASVVIEYSGKQISHESLLRYLLSFRMHSEFHEHCVERIYMDIQQFCQPETLSVLAMYTRRGGLDINPFRSSEKKTFPCFRINRQ
jgi:7-cyano-7-deazaguanine reductase